jgi:hypothetical protein
MRLTAVFSGVLYGSQIEYKHTTGTCVKCAGKSLPPYISPFESEIGSGGQLACGVGIDMSQGPVYKFPSSIFGYGRECPIINNQVIEKTLLRCSADLSRCSGCPSAHTSQPGSRRAFYCTTASVSLLSMLTWETYSCCAVALKLINLLSISFSRTRHLPQACRPL